MFDGKSMLGIKRSTNDKYHNTILNHIKAAKQQADNVVLEIPKFVSRRVIHDTVRGYLSQSKKIELLLLNMAINAMCTNKKFGAVHNTDPGQRFEPHTRY